MVNHQSKIINPKRRFNEMKKLMVVAPILMVMLCFGAISFAGSLDDTGLPTSPSSAMFTLEDIYYRLDTGAAGTKRPGAFVEPSSGPTAGTGHTLDEVMGLAPTVDDTNGAVPAEILSGKTFWGLISGNWGLKTGTMTNNGAVTYPPGTTDQTVAAGYHNGSGVVSGDADLVPTNIRSGISIFGVAGDSNVVNTSSGDAVAGEISNGKKAWVDGSEVTGSLTCPAAPTGNAVIGDVLSGKTFSNLGGTGLTGNMTNQGATNYAPSAGGQTISAGYYNGLGNVFGDADLSAENIKAGTEIFAVTGTFPSDGNATTGDVKSGSTFYTDSATKHTGSGTKTLSPANDTVSAGYYEATTLSTVDTDLATENIKKDVDIFGIIGTYPLAAIAKTGQTTSYAPGDDWDLEKGVVWPNPRFTNHGDGTVTDNLTGLMWLKEANHIKTNCSGFDSDDVPNDGKVIWQHALDFVAAMNAGAYESYGYNDWHLPNIKELLSLIDWGRSDPALPSGHPFTNVQSDYYWSSTTCEHNSFRAWCVIMGNGFVNYGGKASNCYVWPVRGEQ